MEALQLAREVAGAALEKKGEDVVILNIGEKSSVADYFVIATALSERQVRALADSIEEKLKKQGVRPLGTEGAAGSQWVLVDYGVVVAHIFFDETRFFYDLDGLWHDAERIPVEEPRAAAAAAT